MSLPDSLVQFCAGQLCGLDHKLSGANHTLGRPFARGLSLPAGMGHSSLQGHGLQYEGTVASPSVSSISLAASGS